MAQNLPRRTFVLGAAGALVAASALTEQSSTRAYAAGPHRARSHDAYVTYDSSAGQWTIGTASIRKVVTLQGGVFAMSSLVFLPTNKDLVAGAADSYEFSVALNGSVVTGGTTGWNLSGQSSTTLPNGAIELTIVLVRPGVEVTRTYVVYPGTAVISETTSIKNTAAASVTMTTPSLITQRLVNGYTNNVDFYYMTGGGNFTGSGVLKSVALTPSYARTFDSTDAFEQIPVDGQNTGYLGSNTNGTAVYDTFFIVRDRASSDGFWVTFDYNGRWSAPIAVQQDELTLEVRAQLQSLVVASGDTVQLPKATYGLVNGDIDDLGNAVGDYTYQYLWDYTRKIAVTGTWQWRATPQVPNAFASANYSRYVGGEIVHVDANWYDREGDWQPALASDDFASLSSYAQKSGAQLKVWMPFWQADYGSAVLKDHPDWLVAGDRMGYYGLHLDLARPEVVSWALARATQQQEAWSGYRWRYDGVPSFAPGRPNDLLRQSAGFLALLKGVKDANPEATIDGCASGGETLLMEAVRYSDSQQLTDGNARHYAGYYQSLKLPIDKLGHAFSSEPVVDTDFSSVTVKTPAAAESTRKYFDFQRYLQSEGLIGRWVKVFRPTLASGDHTYVLQRSNRDQSKSYITFSWYASYFGQAMTVFPKGLVPTTNYTVRLYKTPSFSQTATGAYWMEHGVPIASLARGEVVLFNVGGYPGSGTQTVPPIAPVHAQKTAATYLGHTGTEINWMLPGRKVWVSYVEVERNGTVVDKVSIGTFWFMPDSAVGDTYRIRAVTGDGAASDWADVRLAPRARTSVAQPTPAVATSFQLSKDFSLVQGQNNWAYLQRDLRSIGSGNQIYLTNLHTDSANNRWVGEEANTLLTPTMLSPQSPHDVFLKWFAPASGTVRITGLVKLAQSPSTGDGVQAAIFKGGNPPVIIGALLWGWVSLAGTDTTGASHDITVPVNANESIYFAVNQKQTPTFDATNWDPQITYVTTT